MQAIRRSFLSLANDPALKVLLEEDKDVVKAATTLSHEISETMKFTIKFGETQHFDLKDIMENFGSFSLEIGKSLKEVSIAYDAYRDKLKEVKRMQEGLTDLEGKSKSAADKLKKAKASGKPFDMLERDAEETHAEVLNYVAKFEGVKRALIKEAMLLQYQGWGMLGLKLQTIATFGRHLADQIPQGSVGPGEDLPPYLGASVTKQIKSDMMAELESLKMQSLSRYLASKKSSISSMREGSMKDLSIDSARKTSMTGAPLSGKSTSPLPVKPPSPRFTTVLPTTPGAYVDSPPPPLQTVYLQGAIPVPSDTLQQPERRQYQQSPRPSQNSPPKQFVVQQMSSQYVQQPQYVQKNSFTPQQFSQPQFSRPTPDQQIFGRPVQARVEENQRYEDYPDYYSTGAPTMSSVQSRNEPLHYQQVDKDSTLSDDIILCAFCQSGIKADDMNRHLDSNCKLHIARMNST